MKKKLKKMIDLSKKNKYYLIMFAFVLIISLLVPLSGDDWANYYPDITISKSISIAFKFYSTFESRIASRFLINLLCYHKVVWAIINALSLTGIYWSITKLINVKNTIGYLLSMIILLFIPCAMFAQVYSWVTGSITYLFPSSILFCYFTYLFKYYKKSNIKNISLLCLINIITPFFIDNCGAVLVVGNIAFIINQYIKNKKIDYPFIICLILSIISLGFVYFAPGNANRFSTTPLFAEKNFIEKIIYNKKIFINYIYYANVFLILLMCIPINYYLFKVLKKLSLVKWIILIIFNIIPIYSIYFGAYMYNPLIKYAYSLDFYWIVENTFLRSNYIYVFWALFSVLFLFSIFYIVDKKDRLYCYLLLTIGLSSNLVMLLSPTWGFRTTYFTTIFLSMISIYLILNIIQSDSKILKYILKIFVTLLIVYLLIIYTIVYHFDSVRADKIRKMSKETSSLVIKTLPIRYMWNYNCYNEFHNVTYKNYLKNNNVLNSVDYSIELEALKSYNDVIKGW